MPNHRTQRTRCATASACSCGWRAPRADSQRPAPSSTRPTPRPGARCRTAPRSPWKARPAASSRAPTPPWRRADTVDLVHSCTGTTGIRAEQPFERRFRDVHLITQHAFLCEARLENVGQVMFGLEPDWGFFRT